MMNSLIYQGQLLTGSDLEKEYKKRKRDYEEEHIRHGSEIPQGWEVTELKSYIKITRKLPISTILENDVWCLFYELGMQQMSSRNFQINLSSNDRKQIDVFATDDDVAFIVECKTNKDISEKDKLKDDIKKIHSDKSEISRVIWNIIGKKLKPIFVLATYNIIWREDQKELASQKKIHIFDEYDILAIRDLAKLAGNAAKYQLYNEIFLGEKMSQFEVQVPAIESMMQGRTYYTFSMLPDHLLKIAYVHRRKKSSIPFQELTDSYQRILNSKRVKDIYSFINDGGFFPGNLIINFQQKFKVDSVGGKPKYKKDVLGKTRPVILTLPPYYGSAWIIDGQHRLYGYADSDLRFKDTIPVVAFIQEKNQAEIFFNINVNQKPIDKNLLWDLFEDLYQDSNDPKELHLQTISRLAKKLNSSKGGPFENKISIPYLGNEGIIDFKTICNALNRHRLIFKNEGSLFYEDYDNTIDFAAERINDYFGLFADYLSNLWQKGNEGFLLSTAGIGVLFALLSDLITNLDKNQIHSRKKFKEFWENMMTPIIDHLDRQNDETLKEYIQASVGRAQSTDLQVKFTDLIVKDRKKGTFRSPFWNKYLENKQKIEETSTLDLLEREESQTLDFKGSFKLDVDNLIKGNGKAEIKPRVARDGAVKTVASFLNTKGGDVIIGVIEKQRYAEVERDNLDYRSYRDFYLIGIDEEIKSTKNMNKEKYQNDLIQSLDSHFGFKYVYDITFHEFKGITLCRINVPSLDPSEDCYVDDEIFYARRGARSEQLKGKEIQMHKTKYRYSHYSKQNSIS